MQDDTTGGINRVPYAAAKGGVNALVSALMLPLGHLLLRRLGVRRRWSYVFAHVTALLPCVLFYSEFVLTDAILPVIVVGWLLLVHTWLNAPPTGSRRSSSREARRRRSPTVVRAPAHPEFREAAR